MSTRERVSEPGGTVRRDLYLILAGLLDEIYDRPGMLSGGPYDLKRFPETSKSLLEKVWEDPHIPDHLKRKADAHKKLCDSLYGQFMQGSAYTLRKSQPTHLKERREIDEIASELLRAKSA